MHPGTPGACSPLAGYPSRPQRHLTRRASGPPASARPPQSPPPAPPPPRRTAPDCCPWSSSLHPCSADIAASASYQTPFFFLFSLMAERTNFGGWGRFMKLLWWMLQAGQVAGSDVFPAGHIGFWFYMHGKLFFPKQGSPSPKV